MRLKPNEINITKLNPKFRYIMVVSSDTGLTHKDIQTIPKNVLGDNIIPILIEGDVNNIKFIKIPKSIKR